MTEGFLFKEKRVHPRIMIKIPVTYRILEEQQEIDKIQARHKKEGHTQDVSLGGLGILTNEPLPIRGILKIEITLPDNPTKLNALAEVVWSNEFMGGVQFLSMKDEDVQSLKAYLDKASSNR